MRCLVDRTNATVLGYAFADSLFGSPGTAVGNVITIGEERYNVVGVLQREEFHFAAWSGNAFAYRNRRAYIPLTTALKSSCDRSISISRATIGERKSTSHSITTRTHPSLT